MSGIYTFNILDVSKHLTRVTQSYSLDGIMYCSIVYMICRLDSQEIIVSS